MVMDAVRGYVQLASGLTEVTKQRAQQAAKALLQQTGADTLTTGLSSKVTELADEIIATSKSNRQLLQAIVANEVEGAVARLGFVRTEEVAGLTRRVEKLERELADAHEAAAEATTAHAAAAPYAAPPHAAKKAAKKAPAKKAAHEAEKKTAKKAAKKAPAEKA
jgi:polyhydroxyalkanoate synthesis regulator phasin